MGFPNKVSSTCCGGKAPTQSQPHFEVNDRSASWLPDHAVWRNHKVHCAGKFMKSLPSWAVSVRPELLITSGGPPYIGAYSHPHVLLRVHILPCVCVCVCVCVRILGGGWGGVRVFSTFHFSNFIYSCFKTPVAKLELVAYCGTAKSVLFQLSTLKKLDCNFNFNFQEIARLQV